MFALVFIMQPVSVNEVNNLRLTPVLHAPNETVPVLRHGKDRRTAVLLRKEKKGRRAVNFSRLHD